jgi:hypothetical protein
MLIKYNLKLGEGWDMLRDLIIFQISCKLQGSSIPERRKKHIVGLLPPISVTVYGKIE